jgi:DNA end-binding protein Ku
MAARSIASLTLSFGLVSIPVKLYSATESAATIRFNLLSKDGSRLKQQYVSEKDQKVVERSEMVKGYEFEKDRFVLFTADELKALQEGTSHTIDIVAFIPEKAIDPIFYDKAYFLAPDKRGGKPYTLLMQAMRKSGRCALAKWAWKGKQYVVQVRPAEEGLVLQQLLYADEVRSLKDLDIEKVSVSDSELNLALQFIQQISEDSYDPTQYEDEEKKRILETIDQKIAGKEIVATESAEPAQGAQVIDLMEALRASLVQRDKSGKPAAARSRGDAAREAEPDQTPAVAAVAGAGAGGMAADTRERKGVRRAPKTKDAAPPARVRARK